MGANGSYFGMSIIQILFNSWSFPWVLLSLSGLHYQESSTTTSGTPTPFRTMQAVYIFFFALYFWPVESQLREYEVTPNNPNDNERRKEITMPDDPIAYFRTFTKGAEYVGLLQAGRAEFPWVVDIRNEKDPSTATTEESWAVGNLITFQFVMTTCKAVYHLSGDRSIAEVPKPQLRIMICSNYLYENYKRYNEEEEVLYGLKFGKIAGTGGVRRSKQVFTHKLCQVKNYQAWDIALIQLNNGVGPMFYPVIAYMPLYNHGDFDRLSPIDLSHQEAQKMICYVAAFGKSYVNIAQSYIVNYKVKYRVYYNKMQDCERFLKWICEDRAKDPACYNSISTAKGQLMCFVSRASQGTVCDHDRGAPLVCNGEVYGMVTRAAKFRLCNDRLPLYFLVNKFDAFQDFFNKYAGMLHGYPRD